MERVEKRVALAAAGGGGPRRRPPPPYHQIICPPPPPPPPARLWAAPPPDTCLSTLHTHTQFRVALPYISFIAHRAVTATPLRVCGRPSTVRAAAGKAAGRVVPVGRAQARLREEAAAKLADVEL